MATIDLIVLGMLKAQPQSAYELQKNVEYRHVDRWVKVSTPSIYKKVVQLEEKKYIQGEIVRVGKMPEKTIYQITESGEKYFLNLMEKASGQMIKVLLDFNAVIMSLDLVAEGERRKLTEQIQEEITEWKDTLAMKQEERGHVPMTGQTILRQQYYIAEALEKWIKEFQEEYYN